MAFPFLFSLKKILIACLLNGLLWFQISISISLRAQVFIISILIQFEGKKIKEKERKKKKMPTTLKLDTQNISRPTFSEFYNHFNYNNNHHLIIIIIMLCSFIFIILYDAFYFIHFSIYIFYMCRYLFLKFCLDIT